MNTVELASRILTQLGFYQEPSKELGVDDRRDNIVHLIEKYTHPAELKDEDLDKLIKDAEQNGYMEMYIVGLIDGFNRARAILRKAQEK